ncbi:conserved hypothetical protein [Candidatus Sulfopaludibacter sp. SbA3]|nr:conserved hypothetical protein [Candidatus Sulfopaludibacter sp. SbA3]
MHELKATKLSMKEMADFVARMLGEVVIDKTGLDGVYTFELHWSNEDKTSDGVATSPSLPTALQETLGLRLQPQKVPVEFLVVDHAERVPTEN